MLKKDKKNYYYGGIVVALLSIVIVAFNFTDRAITNNTPSITVSDQQFSLDIAATDAQRTRGLSGRESLCGTCGMLFVFDRPARYSLWMSDMHFDIDIIWLREGRVVHIEENVSHTTPAVLYTPPTDADRVLEFNAGTVQETDLAVGQKIRLP